MVLGLLFANHAKAEPGYFCIWTGTGDYTDKKWFTHSSDHKNYIKYYGGAKDCRERALFVVTQSQNKKLYKRLLSNFKNTHSVHPAKKLSKKLFALISEQTPKNTVEIKEVVKETIKPKKVEKKTTTKKKVEKKTKTGGFVLGVPDSPAWDLTASPERKRAYRQKRVSKWQAMSVAAICIQWDEHWEYPRDRLDMSTALENKGENPLVCRSPGQDQISRAKKETQKAKAAAAAAQAEVNKNRKSKNKSCRYITYKNMNGAEVRKKVCN